MKKILFVTKEDNKRTLKTEEVVDIFEKTDNMDSIRKAVEMAEDRVYATWATVEMKDNDGELIPIENMIKQQETLMERNGPISDMHSNRIVGRTLAYKVLEHPKTKSMGILHLEKIYNDNQVDDTVWKEIQSGERTGSSVGGVSSPVPSFTKDKVTGETARVLDDFAHMETASVDVPANPMALNEAFSVIAKSDSHSVKKPFSGFKDFDDCVRQSQDKDDPEAYCASIMRAVEGKKGEKEDENSERDEKGNDINKLDNNQAIEQNNKGDNMTEDNVKKESESEETLKSVSDRLSILEKKQEEPKEEEKPEEEDKKKAEADEEDENEEEKKKKVKKEEAKGDIEGEADAPQEDSPVVEDSNDKDVFKNKEVMKKFEAKFDKKVEELKTNFVMKADTPFPGTQPVNKADKVFADLPLDLAYGKKKMNYHQVNKANNDHLDRLEGIK